MSAVIRVTKDVECYSMRHLPHGCWADIYVEPLGNSGTLMIRSDYGDWAFFWWACGVPFKQFLVEIGRDYLAGKLMHGKPDHFDLDTLCDKLRKRVDQSLEEFEITKEEADEICENICELRNEGLRTSEGVWIYMRENLDHLREYMVDRDMPECGTSPLLKRFLDEAWPLFIERIKEEISATA